MKEGDREKASGSIKGCHQAIGRAPESVIGMESQQHTSTNTHPPHHSDDPQVLAWLNIGVNVKSKEAQDANAKNVGRSSSTGAGESVTGMESQQHRDTAHPPHHSVKHPDPQMLAWLNVGANIKSDEAQAASEENVDRSSRTCAGESVTGMESRQHLDTHPPHHSVTHSGVTIKTEEAQDANAENVADASISEHGRPNVGLLKAQSPWLRKDGVCIAVLEDKSVSQFL